MLAGSSRVGAGENNTELRTGDFIVFGSDIDHEIGNPEEVPAEVCMVVCFAAGHGGQEVKKNGKSGDLICNLRFRLLCYWRFGLR